MTTIEPGRGPTVRWTEHGPEPVEAEPSSPAHAQHDILGGHALEVDTTPTETETETEHQQPPAARGVKTQTETETEHQRPPAARGVETETEAGHQQPPAAREAGPETWPPATASVPAEAEQPEAPAGTEAEPEDPSAVLARLRAKGLLRTEPSIRIREVAGDAPRPIVTFEPEQPLTTGREIVDDDLGDPEELEPELPGPATVVRCPGCRTRQPVADNATGFKCTSCAKVWRWATCTGCHELNLTIARQESWRCTGCGSFTRSWWRTPTRAAEHRRVAEARATEAAERRRREAYEKARRRRWKLLTVGAVAILATAFAAVTFTRNAAPVTTRGANGRVCEAFADVQRSINSQGSRSELRASLDAMASESVDAIDRIRLPAQQLAGSVQPGDEAFDKAARALSNACTA